MILPAVAFALVLHVFFWGAGAAMLGMPGRWNRFWPVLALPAGFALQSLVVWVAAYADIPGTNAYAWPAGVLPLVLFGAALRRHGLHRFRADLARFGLVWVALAGALLALVLPLAIASRGLNTISLGSCDAADYAAGARVFMEFSRSDRSGFLGLTEVVRVMSADNFFDFWLRLNHFTPSALIALNGSILDCAPHQLTGVLTAAVLVAGVPVVFWVCRALFGYSGAASLTIASVYGISPIPWYSMAHVSPAPLLAAQAIALLTWSGVALWNGRLSWNRGWQFSGVLCVGYVLVLGSYNFILVVCLVPALAYAGSRALAIGAWARLGRWAVIVAAPLGAAGLIFWDRVAGLVERFALFQTYDFGWRIPVLGPDGWLGMVQGGDLEPWPWGLRWVLAAIVVTAWSWGVVRAAQAGRWRIWLISSVTIPVLMGYAFLQVRGALIGSNASYDAFKLFTVFHPLLLPAFCWWITLRWSTRLTDWLVVAALAAVVVILNVVSCGMFVWKMSRPPLIVDGEVRQLRKVEDMPDVASVNLLIPDMWSRLWANQFLLRKPQYFLTHTYEGRLNTPLRGEWDLSADVVHVDPGGAGSRQVTTHYRLIDTRTSAFARAQLGDGWHSLEQLRNGERWRWTRGDATVHVDNPHSRPLAARVVLDGRSTGEREVSIAPEGVSAPFVRVGGDRQKVTFPEISLPPGRSTLVIRSRQPPVATGADERTLGICVFSLVLETR